MISRTMVADLEDAGKAGEVRSQLSALANNYFHSYKPTTTQLKKHRIMEKLRKNKDIVILKPDKGNAVVILDRQVYVDRMHELISDRSKFVELDEDPTMTREGSIQRHLRKLKKSGLFGHSKEEIDPKYRKVYPNGSRPARLYGLPKMHKFTGNNVRDIPFRPILSALGTTSYNTAKYLDEILQPLIPDRYSCKDTFAFLEDIKSVSPEIVNKYMVSFDVTSLFTNIPLDETLDLAVNLIMTNRPDLKCSKRDLKTLFLHATSKTHFLFNGKYYDQIDGVAMGSPLGPTLANLFMGHHERHWLEEFAQINGNILFYRRYVDDIFAVFESESDAMNFLEFLNKQHPCIKFTCEPNVDSQLPFLDIHISNANKISTTLFRKKTYTGLLTNFFSYTAENYKIGLIKNLLFRAYAINNSWNGFHTEIMRIKKILQQNSFPIHVIDRTIKTFLNKVCKPPVVSNDTDSNGAKVNRYFKLPFRGKHSGLVRKKLLELSDKYCKESLIKIVFTSLKLGSYLSPKDPIPVEHRSHVVYKYTCPGCNARYIGETTRHIKVRSHEHFYKEQEPSAIYLHLRENINCYNKRDFQAFNIIDHGSSWFNLRLKESFHIGWDNPQLNKQVKHEKITLSV